MKSKFVLNFFLFIFIPLILILPGIKLYMIKQEVSQTKEMIGLIESLNNTNISHVAKQLSSFNQDLRDPVIISCINTEDFIRQDLIIKIIAHYKIESAVPELIELFKKTDKDVIAYDIVFCLIELNNRFYSKQLMDLLKNKDRISEKKREYLTHLASTYAIDETVDILLGLIHHKNTNIFIKINASQQIQKINEPVLIKELGTLFEEKNESAKLLKEILMRLDKSPEVTFAINKFLLDHSDEVDGKFLVYTFSLFDEESMNILLVIGKHEKKRELILAFFSKLAGKDLKEIEDAKYWWSNIDKNKFFLYFDKGV